MPKNRFYIGPLNSGLEKNTKPFMIADDAFERLQNAYVYRGYVRKRFGALPLNTNVATQDEIQQFTRLRINVGTTNVIGVIAGTVPGTTWEVGQMFTVGDSFFTVVAPGNVAMITTSGTAVLHTFDTATGNFLITEIAYPNTIVYFYPSQPVMGFATYETNAINDEPTYAFDTQFAYQYSVGAWARMTAEAVAGDALWHGSNTDFVWHTNYRGINVYDNILFVTNFNTTDHIRYWDSNQWATLRPAYLAAANHFIETARIIVPFKDRLLLLNTVESVAAVNRSYPQRCRYCANGSPFAANAWREDIPGQGDLIDAPIKEQIISAQLFKDRLIVFFEKSTWEIVYTGNHLVPFVWQKINSELGVESTFSTVLFDKAILGVGDVGLHACTGTNVERIDSKIPDEVFAFHNDNIAMTRIQGIRDYYTEQVYWTIPSSPETVSIFPTKVLVFNYQTNSWAYNDDTITAFGYKQHQNDLTWQDTIAQWQGMDMNWNSGVFETAFKYVVAGNQQGWTFVIRADEARNGQSLQITDVAIVVATGNAALVVINHNLEMGDYVYVEDLVGINGIAGIYRVGAIVDVNTFEIEDSQGYTGVYQGRGTVERVSQIDIITKQYNFYAQQGQNLYISEVDFNVDRTVNGEITVDSYVSSSNRGLILDADISGALIGDGTLETFPLTTFENSQARFWRKMFLQSEGECVQFRIYLADDQMTDQNVAFSDFQLNGFVITAEPTYEF